MQKPTAVEADRERWRAAVAGVLAKSTKRDPADLPAEPERLLDSPTYDGFAIRPLYTSADELPEPPLPGHWPFVRGGDALRDVKSGWKVVEPFPVNDDDNVSEHNGAVLLSLTEGVSALAVRVGDKGIRADELDRFFDGVFLDLVPVIFDAAGPDYARTVDAVLGLVDGFDDDQRARLAIDFGADPLTAPLSGRAAPDAGDVTAAAARVTGFGGHLRTVTVDGPAFHNRGANASWELAGLIGAGVEYLRLFGAAGLDVSDALRQISFRVAVDDDQFMGVAKLRAARKLWARVAEVVGAKDAGAATVHAVTSLPMMTKRDPWVNMLRGTVACFAAAVGGADAITVQPFDAAIGLPDTFSRRIARNTSSILAEESKLSGVIDPAGGSWFVEKLTDDLARAAWREFQELESLGGIVAALDSGALAERLEATWQARAKNLATRKDPLTGVSEFPNLDERAIERKPLPASRSGGLPTIRYGQEFERLRDRAEANPGGRPRVFLATLGPIAQHTARATFAANLFAAGGIEAVNPGATASTADVVAAYLRSHTSVACLCGTDLAYEEQADEVAAALRKAGATRVLLAGKPSDAYTGVDGFIYAGCNALEVLTATLEHLEVA